MTATLQSELTLRIERTIDIDAPPKVVFDAMLHELGPGNMGAENKPMPMKLEAWPGGRWYRDMGSNTGHLWGHVQVIKPPTLLEITGPLFMSYAAVSHVQYRLAEMNGSTMLTITHTAIGDFDPAHREGVGRGWASIIERIRQTAIKRA